MRCLLAQWLHYAALLFTVISLPSRILADEIPVPDGWKLVWHDEFKQDGIDASKWSPCDRGRSDWNNTMSNDPRCFAVKEGCLELRGFVNQDRQNDSAPYLTGGVTSKGKFQFQYGKVEIRARFQSARGAWPALWMLGAEGPWPSSGEIDLMEHLNFEDIVYQTVHSEYTHRIDKTNTPRKGGTAKIERDEFNTYGLEWDEDKLVFFVNGRPTLTYPRVPGKGSRQWPFDGPFYFILSMQIGGNWVGEPDPRNFPAGMEIDWVRVYQRP